MPERSQERLAALDAFRGLTVAAMILVNNPGEWDAVYRPLQHAAWNGWTPTDLIFPFFLFITGVTTYISLKSPSDERRWPRVLKRTALIFALGLFLNGFPLFDLSTLRIPGVLQRIALCYAGAAALTLVARTRTRVIVFGLIGVGYAMAMQSIPMPGSPAGIVGPGQNLAAWIDERLLPGHLLHDGWDPEGILTTLPALATALCGVFAGEWLCSLRSRQQQAVGLAAAGLVGLALGLALNPVCPINKTIWSSSFVLFSGGAALAGLALCLWLIDVHGWRRWSTPFVAYGRNPIVAYVLSTLVAKQLLLWSITQADGTSTNAANYIFQTIYLPLASPVAASLLYAATYTLLWLAVAAALYRQGVLIKI